MNFVYKLIGSDVGTIGCSFPNKPRNRYISNLVEAVESTLICTLMMIKLKTGSMMLITEKT